MVDVDAGGLGTLAYVYGGPVSTLTRLLPNGWSSTVDLAAYEASANPDQVNTYGPYVAGTPSPLASVPLPNGLAVGTDGTVYAAILSLTPDGQVVPITP